MNKTIIALAFPLLFFLQPCSAMEQVLEPIAKDSIDQEIEQLESELRDETQIPPIHRTVESELRQETQMPPIHKAIEDENIEQIQQLIARRVSLNRRDSKQQTPLHRAVRLDNVDIAQLLLENRAEASLQDDEGDTPLHIATRQNAVLMAMVLMAFSATVDIRNNEGKTALHIATINGCTSLVDLCLQGGASPDIKTDDNDDITAFEIARRKNDKQIMTMLKEASDKARSEFEKGTFKGYARQGAITATTVIMNDPQIQKGIMRGLLKVARGTLSLALRGAEKGYGYVQSKCIIL